MSAPVVAFVTLFLSLIVGPQPVEVRVGDEVDRVEIELDGSRVAILSGPSWRRMVDFGRRLEPRRLEAIAFDEAGEELDRAVQWVNLPTRGAEVEVVLERDDRGRSVAALTWANVTGVAPETIRANFDGRPLEIDDPARIVLPPYDPAQIHFLRIEMEFPDSVSVVEEVTFGGSYGDRLNTELTATAVSLEPSSELPEAEELAGWFSVDGTRGRIAAVDEGPAEIIVIRDRAAQPSLERLGGHGFPGAASGARQPYWGRFDGRLRKDQNLGFFWPFLVESPSGRWTFPATYGWMSARDGGVGWFLARVPPPKPPLDEQLLTDAVAVAGLNALSRNRRRAVVLILGKTPADSSRLLPAQARHYLRALRVPLFVWSPYGHPSSPWGEMIDISTPTKLRRAVDELSDRVDRQYIVWIEGRHLPQQIELTAEATGIELAG